MSLRILSLPLLLALGLLGPGSGAGAQAGQQCGPAGNARIYIDVERIRSSRGLIAVTVYGDNPRKFLAKRGALYVVRTPARAPTTRVCVNLPTTGVYGFGVYHDADGDRGFDRNGIGLPAEAWGFSNNAPTILGLPSFSAVRMNVPRTNMRTAIRLRYP